jgi:hypothetical protein
MISMGYSQQYEIVRFAMRNELLLRPMISMAYDGACEALVSPCERFALSSQLEISSGSGRQPTAAIPERQGSYRAPFENLDRKKLGKSAAKILKSLARVNLYAGLSQRPVWPKSLQV